jgi:EAL domain-containing protein (putative c-di-GMP-specific phosphodiesterase class I)
MNIKAIERMNMGNNLRTALERRQFIVYYQPLVGDVQQIVGAEALLRWQHPLMGLVNPDKFIHLAEETGIIVPIGEWVLRTACKQAKKWHDMGYKGLYVAVNLSTRQFREKNLSETIERILDETGLSPNYLKLEVTESGIMEDPEAAIAKMNRLRSKGIRFSIDDFGTGYSSLSYMKRFPIDTLKIDRSFIAESATNRDDREIIKTIISMARNLSIETVAEGVENKDQQDFLSRQGCRMMQGYYFGRPMPARELEDVLRRKDIVLKEGN